MSNDTALIVIDVQLGLFQLRTPIFNAEQLLTNINALIKRARPKGVPVIFIQHNGTEESPVHPDSPGWVLHPAIVRLEDEPVVVKEHRDAFQKTNLRTLLMEKEITKLVITGLVTDGCVRATCRNALKLGYQITLVADAHSTRDSKIVPAQKEIRRLNRTIEKEGGQVKTTAQVTFA